MAAIGVPFRLPERLSNMPLLPGLYKVAFQTQLGEGVGIVVLEGGSLRGGDAVYAWVGTYEEPNGGFDAKVSIFRHTPGEAAASVFGVDDAVVQLNGQPGGEASRSKALPPRRPRCASKLS